MILPLLHWCGRITTRLLLWPPVRRIPGMSRTYTALYLLGKHASESSMRSLIRSHVSAGMHVADIGANVGFYTTFLARLTGREGRVFAFEPDPLTGAILRRRTQNLPQVSVIPLALSNDSREMTLVCNPANRANNSLIFDKDASIKGEKFTVSTVSFDSWWESEGKPRIGFIKIDTEGAELMVLRGMERFLEKSPPPAILLEFSPPLLRQAGVDPVALLSFLIARRYALSSLENPARPAAILDPHVIAKKYEDSFVNLWATHTETR